MSVINKMLRDLDDRVNKQPRGPSNIPLAIPLEPKRKGLAAAIVAGSLAAVAIVAWAAWQFWPSKAPAVASAPAPAAQPPKASPAAPPVEAPKVAETPKAEPPKVVEPPKPTEPPKVAEAPKVAEPPKAAPKVEAPKPAQVAAAPKAAETKPAEAPKPAPVQVAAKTADAPKKVEPAQPAPIKAAETKVVSPPSPHAPASTPAAPTKVAAAPQLEAIGAAKSAVAQSNAAQAAREQALAAPLAAVQSPAAPQQVSPPPRPVERTAAPIEAPSAATEMPRGRIGVERAEATTPKQRATAAYRAGQDAVSQGRIDEAIAQYAQAVRADPSHNAARQALVVILLDRNRRPEAQDVLREGLAVSRENVSWAMLLARLQVEANDVPGALATLEGSLAYGRNEPDYLGVMATLMQMQGRHSDAVGYYQAATRLSPEAGRWLIGLGLSLEELKRPAEAKDAYLRARDTGKLAREHQALVDQKLRQLR